MEKLQSWKKNLSTKTPVNYPQADGKIESCHRTIEECLRIKFPVSIDYFKDFRGLR